MPIKYYLQSNPITPDLNDQSARVSLNDTMDTDQVILKMLQRGSTITEADIRAVLNVFFTVVAEEVADGNSVNLPLVNIRPGISGVFTSANDSFDGSRHIKKASISAGLLLGQKLSSAAVEKILSSMPAPVLIEFADINSQTTNSKLTPGGIGQIIGEELKFNPQNAAEGVFLVDTAYAATKVSILAVRTEGKLMFSIPGSLANGTYTLEVRKGYGTTGSTIRGGTLSDLLQVGS